MIIIYSVIEFITIQHFFNYLMNHFQTVRQRKPFLRYFGSLFFFRIPISNVCSSIKLLLVAFGCTWTVGCEVSFLGSILYFRRRECWTSTMCSEWRLGSSDSSRGHALHNCLSIGVDWRSSATSASSSLCRRLLCQKSPKSQQTAGYFRGTLEGLSVQHKRHFPEHTEML